MAKRILIVLCACVWLAPATMAQVAAPTLVPGFVTDNPAVIQWGAPSRVGIVAADSEVERLDTTTTPATAQNTELDGAGAGFRLVGEQLSLAAEFIRTSGKFGIFDLEQDTLNAALALQVLDLIAIGAGVSNESGDLSANTGLGPVMIEGNTDINQVGVSLKIGDLLFLGAAVGEETSEENTTVTQFPVFDSQSTIERDVAAYGVGLLNREGTKWHLEFTVKQADFVQDTVTGRVLEEEEERTGLLEVNFGGFLIGVGSSTTETTDQSTTPATTVEEKGQGVQLGWVPEEGLAAVLVYQTSEADPSPGVTVEATSTILIISYLF